MELVEAAAVVLPFQVTLDILEHLFDALEAGVQSSNLVLCCQVLEELGVAGLTSGSLVSHVLEDGVGSLVGELEAAAEVDELCGDTGVENSVAFIAGLDRWGLVLEGLLKSTALVGGDVLGGSGFKRKLEDLEGVGILWGSCCDTEGVAGRKRDLNRVSRFADGVLEGVGAYLVGGEADLVIHGHLKERVGVLQPHHRRPSQIPIGIVTASEGKAVDIAVTLVVCCAIVQESTNTSAPSTVCINDESEAIELAHGVDTGGANASLTVFGIP